VIISDLSLKAIVPGAVVAIAISIASPVQGQVGIDQLPVTIAVRGIATFDGAHLVFGEQTIGELEDRLFHGCVDFSET
jgi:hypothetical protein